MSITKKDIVKTWNLAEECQLSSSMTQLEICNKIKNWIDTTLPFLKTYVFETYQTSTNADRSKIMVCPGNFSPEDEKLFGAVWGSQVAVNNDITQTYGTGIYYGQEENGVFSLLYGQQDATSSGTTIADGSSSTNGTGFYYIVNYPFGIQLTKDQITSLKFTLIKTKNFYAFNFFKEGKEKQRPGMIICYDNGSSDYFCFQDYTKGTSQRGRLYFLRYKNNILLNSNNKYIDTTYRSQRNTAEKKILTNLAIPCTNIICENIFIGNGDSFVENQTPYYLQSDSNTYYIDISGEPETLNSLSTYYSFKVETGDNFNLYKGFTDEEWNAL